MHWRGWSDKTQTLRFSVSRLLVFQPFFVLGGA